MSDVGTITVAAIGGAALIAQAVVQARAGRERRVLREEVADVRKDTREINDAVNHKDNGMPTLVQRVVDQDERGRSLARELAADREWQQDAMRIMAREMGLTLPPPPPLAIRRTEPQES